MESRVSPPSTESTTLSRGYLSQAVLLHYVRNSRSPSLLPSA